MFRTVTSDMRYFLIMMGIFIVSNGFALTLLFPTHLHPHGDAAPDSEATMYLLRAISMSTCPHSF